MLSTTFKTYTTEGNLNNHIGIPLTILKIKEDAQIAVIEMGANHQREIAGYCEYTMPTQGLITNCGKAHLEGFGSLEGVRKGKGELFDYLTANEGMAFINQDLDYLEAMSKNIREKFSYGLSGGSITGKVKRNEDLLEMSVAGDVHIEKIQTHLVGDYNAANVLAAVAVGHYFKVTKENIVNALESYQPSNSRSQMLKKDSNTFILDAYNANPSSMAVAIENFRKMNGENKVLMLGGMKEMGEEAVKEHQALVDRIKDSEWKAVVLVGQEFMGLDHDYTVFENSLQAKEWLAQAGLENSMILIKGSRGSAMEKVLS